MMALDILVHIIPDFRIKHSSPRSLVSLRHKVFHFIFFNFSSSSSKYPWGFIVLMKPMFFFSVKWVFALPTIYDVAFVTSVWFGLNVPHLFVVFSVWCFRFKNNILGHLDFILHWFTLQLITYLDILETNLFHKTPVFHTHSITVLRLSLRILCFIITSE